MATKIRADIQHKQAGKMVQLALRLDKIFARLFKMKIEGSLDSAKYNSLLLSFFGRQESFQKEMDNLWKSFVELKNDNSLKVPFSRGKKKKYQRNKGKLFILKTDVGEDFVRLAMTMDNIQTLIIRLSLARCVPAEKGKMVSAMFNNQVEQLAIDTDELEKVKKNVAESL